MLKWTNRKTLCPGYVKLCGNIINISEFKEKKSAQMLEWNGQQGAV